MRVAGIIAEYNPFHNGHAKHIALTRAASGCDYVVAAMSGAFTQRGEPALGDKWTRAQMALESGCDLVLELPALYAVRPAEQFAWGGISLLGALNAVDVLSFGCETSDRALLERMADVLEEEPPEFSREVRARLDQGQSHARARGGALAKLMALDDAQVNAPNTVLALEYIRANRRLARPMELMPIQRVGGYHDLSLNAAASASAIRAAIRAGRMEEAAQAMPERAFALLKDCPMPEPGALDNVLLYRLRDLAPEQIARLPDVGEGLERRVKRMAERAASRAELLSLIKCKRYTMARLSRILTYALLRLDRALDAQYARAPYARVLGFREDARPLLRALNAASDIPVVSDASALKAEPCFQLERRATDLWGLATQEAALRRSGRDATERVRIV